MHHSGDGRPPDARTTPSPRFGLEVLPAQHDRQREALRVLGARLGASKAAVSMLTVQYANAVPEVKFNAVEPGITATELGGGEPGSHPGRPAAESARIVAAWATIGPDGPSGTFQEDAGVLGW